jgi:rare lipoprotein A
MRGGFSTVGTIVTIHRCGLRKTSLAVLVSLLSFGPADAGAGVAAFYGGGRTASGEVSGPNGFTAAHRTLPFGTKVLVTNVRNGRNVVVRIIDRGPYGRGRIIDVSRSAARELDMIGSGTTSVSIMRQ